MSNLPPEEMTAHSGEVVGSEMLGETDAEFIARLRVIARDWRFSDEYIGIVVRGRYPCDYDTADRAGAANAG